MSKPSFSSGSCSALVASTSPVGPLYGQTMHVPTCRSVETEDWVLTKSDPSFELYKHLWRSVTEKSIGFAFLKKTNRGRLSLTICHINRRKLENPSIFISSQFKSHTDPGNVRRKCRPDHKNKKVKSHPMSPRNQVLSTPLSDSLFQIVVVLWMVWELVKWPHAGLLGSNRPDQSTHKRNIKFEDPLHAESDKYHPKTTP